MKKYVFEITITEDCDEFWEMLKDKGESGCDFLKKEIEESLPICNYFPEVKLKKFTDE